MSRPIARELRRESGHDDHFDHHARRTKDKQRLAAEAVDDEEGHGRADELHDVDNAREVEAAFVIQAKSLEECGGVVNLVDSQCQPPFLKRGINIYAPTH